MSCQHQIGMKDHYTKQAVLDSNFYLLGSLVGKFSLTNDVISGDSNQLTFCYEKKFDTSLLISFRKDGDRIRAIVYQVVQFYYQNGGKRDENRKDLQFFEGFSFSVDTADWQSTVKDAAAILNSGPFPDKESGIFDGPTYLLAFNAKIRVNRNPTDDSLLLGFLNLMKNRFIYKCMEEKPVWRRIKDK